MFTNSLLLRRSNDLAATAAALAEVAAEGGKLGRIVIADPDSAEMDHLASVLRNLNFTVLTAHDGKSALALTKRHRPALLIASLELPVIDGYQLAQRLREDPDTERIPVMFIVESGVTADQQVGHQTFAHDYIQKPVSAEEFKRRVLALARPSRPRPSVEPGKPPAVAETTPSTEEGRQGAEKQETKGVFVEGAGASWDDLILELRRLLAQVVDCVSRLEQRLRLIHAVRDPGLPAADLLPLVCRERRDPESMSGIRGASKADAAALGRSVKAVHETPAEREKTPSVESAEEVLRKLEDYRAEFQRLQAKQRQGGRSEREGGVDSSCVEHEAAERTDHPGRKSSDAEGKADGGSDRERGSGFRGGEVNRTRFDKRLVGAIPELRGPRWEDLESQEWMESTRQSFVSAFLEEKRAVSQRAETIYEEACAVVLEAIRKAAVGESPSLIPAEQLVHRLLSSLRNSDQLLASALDRRQAFSVTAHSVNVTILGLRIALEEGRSEALLGRVGLAALMHEVGVVRLPENLVFKEGPLSEDELAVLRRRPLFSSELLKEQFGNISEIVAQVYERENGSGFPMGLAGAEIRPEAKILAVADVFEACIHPRPYRDPLTGYQALYMLSETPEFSPSVVRSLVRAVTLFPLHEVLKLSTGEIVRVVRLNRNHPERPVVRVLRESDGRWVTSGKLLDLAQLPNGRVVEILTEKQVESLR